MGGIVVDFLITARGCIGECNYCSIAAYTSEQRRRFRLREPEAVADEIAVLHRERGARVMFVQDDLFVLPSENKSVERAERITHALKSHGADDTVFWVKGRPETITPRVCQALHEMGVIHMFLGVESASSERLSYLGRTHEPADNRSAIAICREHGITPSFNFMLFDPDCSLADVAQTLDLSRTLELPWNVCPRRSTPNALRDRSAEAASGDWRAGVARDERRAEILFRICAQRERARGSEPLSRLISLFLRPTAPSAFLPWVGYRRSCRAGRGGVR